MSLSTIVPLLEQLHRELAAIGDSRKAALVAAVASAEDSGMEAFLKSNELWGGAGSIADEAGTACSREDARRIEAAMIELGQQQLQLGIANVRTASWVRTFSDWRAQGI